MVNLKENAVTYCEEFVFEPTGQKLIPVLINDDPHFVAKEICDILRLKNSRQAVRSLDGDEKLVYVLHTSGQRRKVNLVNESGLYNLIFQSHKPDAKIFRRWITHVVIPTIRKTGQYSMYGPICDVYPIIHNGKVGYPRKELFAVLGYSPKGGAASYWKKKNPEQFFTICRTACVSPEFAKEISERRKPYQLVIPFDEVKQLNTQSHEIAIS
jgi:hypothetical protein